MIVVQVTIAVYNNGHDDNNIFTNKSREAHSRIPDARDILFRDIKINFIF